MRVRRLLPSSALALGLTLGVVWVLGCSSPVAHAQGPDGHSVYYVALSCTGVPTPCHTTVQAAVDAADDPDDVIKVAGGVYTGVQHRPAPAGYVGPSVVTQVVYISKTVIIQGGYTVTNWTVPDPEVNLTVLDAARQGRVLLVAGNVTPSIQGLHMTGGSDDGLGGDPWGQDIGGGVAVISAAAVIRNNQLSDNWGFLGGGLGLVNSSAVVGDNTFVDNSAHSGAGLSAYCGSPTISGNTFTANHSDYSGGGLSLYESSALVASNTVVANTGFLGAVTILDRSDATLVNNVIANNQEDPGWGKLDAIEVVGSSPWLLHNTVARNGDEDGIGIYVWEGYWCDDRSHVVMSDTILVGHGEGIRVTAGNTVTLDATLWDNQTDWAGAGTIITGAHNYWGDPAFVNPDTGDYHICATSAAIDRGVNAGVDDDIDGEARPNGAACDIGADEFYFEYAVRLPLVLRNH